MQLLRRISWAQRRYLIHLTPSLLEKIVVFAQKISDFLGWKYIFSQFNFQEGVGWKPKSINISCTGGPIRTKIFSHGHKKPPNIPCNELLNWFILCALPSICTHLDSNRYLLWQKFPVTQWNAHFNFPVPGRWWIDCWFKLLRWYELQWRADRLRNSDDGSTHKWK